MSESSYIDGADNIERADDAGMTFTDVARLLGISRQMASRLYRATAVG